jgi:hypothetical protein
MRWLLFISRLAFICNILFVVSLIAQRVQNVFTNADINNYIVILGWFVSPFLNLLFAIAVSTRFITKKPNNVPAWLLITNILFLFFQIFYHFVS